ncbi:MAG: hypothetical protein JWM34_3165 [Ilumatobacteraceae bacterium]|nr:hypothetical protein [Ilumatobacteraceae bacterium]
MRQFFSWRIWAAFAALAGLALALKIVLPAGQVSGSAPNGQVARNVQFVSLVYAVQVPTTFTLDDGVVKGQVDFILDGQRTMHIYTGTPGEITCPDYSGVAQCVVLADLLGDAVVWFALVPVQPGSKVIAPPIVALPGDGIAELENGWRVPMEDVVDRSCPQETASLTDFIREFGPQSTTIIDVAAQKVSQVRCSPSVTAISTP